MTEPTHQTLVVDGHQTDSAQGARKLLKIMRQQKRLGRGKTSINLRVSKTLKPIDEDQQKEQQERIFNRTLKKVVVNEQNNIAPIVRSRKKKITFSEKNDLSFKDLKDKFNTSKAGETDEEDLKDGEEITPEDIENLKKEFEEYKVTSKNELDEHIKIEQELKTQVENLTPKYNELNTEFLSLNGDKIKSEVEGLNEKIKQQENNFNEEMANKMNDNNGLIAKNQSLEKEVYELKNPKKNEVVVTLTDEENQQLEEEVKKDFISEIDRLNCEIATIKVENLNKQFENESLINKYKNIIISVKKKYKIKNIDI